MGIVEDLMEESSGVFVNEQVLNPSFIPDEVVGREEQQRLIMPAIRPLSSGNRAGHLILQGFNGSGKTVTIQYVLRRAKAYIERSGKHHTFRLVSLTGTKDMNPNKAMRELVEQVISMGLTKKDLSITTLMDSFLKTLAEDEKPAVLLFDEIDLFLKKPLNELINLIAREQPNISIVGTTNDPLVMSKINDRRIESAFRPLVVVFPPYNSDELRDILEERAKMALYPKAIANEVIPLCAAFAAGKNGDARYAIQLLGAAASKCINDGRKKIEETDVRAAVEMIENEDVQSIKLQLTRRHKAILEALLNERDMRRADLKTRYETILDDAFSQSTFLNDLKILE
jgi:cell division control protein 6